MRAESEVIYDKVRLYLNTIDTRDPLQRAVVRWYEINRGRELQGLPPLKWKDLPPAPAGN